jgi:PAS domain-containing protein
MAETLKGRPKLLDSIPASFILTDIHTRILYVNQQAEIFFGYAKEELEGERLRFLFLEEDLLFFLPNIVFMTRYKKGFEGEVLLRQKAHHTLSISPPLLSRKERASISFQEIQRVKVLRGKSWKWKMGHRRMVEEISHQFIIRCLNRRLLNFPRLSPFWQRPTNSTDRATTG